MSATTPPVKTISIMGRKRGMIQMFSKDGALVPCTVIEAAPNVIVQIKTSEIDGYNAVQLGFDEVRTHDARTIEKRVTKPLLGHFKKANVAPVKFLAEFHVERADEYSVGQKLGIEQFAGISHIDVSGTSKGKGYQGVMKKYNFKGGPASHGSGFHRHAGSTGMRSTPGRCLPGGPRPSHMGDENMTVQNLRVVAIDEAKQLIIVEGAVPGAKNSLVSLSPAIKHRKQQKTKRA